MTIQGEAGDASREAPDSRAGRGAFPATRGQRERTAKDVLERTEALGLWNAILGSAIGFLTMLVFAGILLYEVIPSAVTVLAVLALVSGLGWALAGAGSLMRRATRVREARRVRRAIVVATATSGIVALGALAGLVFALMLMVGAPVADFSLIVGCFLAIGFVGVPVWLVLGNARVLREFPHAVADVEEIRTIGRLEREAHPPAAAGGAPGGA